MVVSFFLLVGCPCGKYVQHLELSFGVRRPHSALHHHTTRDHAMSNAVISTVVSTRLGVPSPTPIVHHAKPPVALLFCGPVLTGIRLTMLDLVFVGGQLVVRKFFARSLPRLILAGSVVMMSFLVTWMSISCLTGEIRWVTLVYLIAQSLGAGFDFFRVASEAYPQWYKFWSRCEE